MTGLINFKANCAISILYFGGVSQRFNNVNLSLQYVITNDNIANTNKPGIPLE